MNNTIRTLLEEKQKLENRLRLTKNNIEEIDKTIKKATFDYEEEVIKRFNSQPFVYLNDIQVRLKNDCVTGGRNILVGGYESDTYINHNLRIYINKDVYKYSLVLKDGKMEWIIGGGNDGVSLKYSEDVVRIVEGVLFKKD